MEVTLWDTKKVFFMFAGWRVTSDFSLKVLEDDTRIAITCNAISQGHHGDTMMKKAEVMLTVLSKWMYTHTKLPQAKYHYYLYFLLREAVVILFGLLMYVGIFRVI